MGFSLVEVLVALVISLFLLGGVIQMYAGNKATYNFSEAISRIQENGRFAIDIITQDLRLAGFRGCATANFVNYLNTGHADYDASLHDFFNESSIEGTENTGTNGSDGLIIRGAAPGQANIIAPFNTTLSSNINININDFMQQGDIALISKCVNSGVGGVVGADIFQVTGVGSVGGTNNSLAHGIGTEVPGNSSANLSQTYQQDTAIFKMQTVTYSIGTGASGEPALFRAEFTDVRELVDGIEQMQILYGINTDANPTPNQYVTSNNVPDWNQVTAVRIMLLLVSTETLPGENQTYFYNNQTITATDFKLRHVFTTTVALRNNRS